MPWGLKGEDFLLLMVVPSVIVAMIFLVTWAL